MPTLLAIEVSPRHEFSTSRKLTALFIDQWKAAHPGAAVIVRDLMRTPPPFVDLAWIGGAFTPRTDRDTISPAPPDRTPIDRAVPGWQQLFLPRSSGSA